MDALMLSRLQFAITSMFHFFFVPLTLGLSILTAVMETRYAATGNATFLKMAKFWGKLFLINFALGIVTGITLEFQFGMNWAEYSKYVGDIFGVPLAIEATVAFFLESVFMGVWIFGWNKLPKKIHALSIWLVAIATNLSALWILLANGWMQHPVGYVLRNHRAEMVDFGAFLTNTYGWLKFGHTLASGYVVAAFFVMGISAYHLLRKQHIDFFKRSFKMAALFGLGAVLLVALIGDAHTVNVAQTQPVKFAAMESVWETQTSADYTLLTWPNTKEERNYFELFSIPKLLSFLSTHDFKGEVKGLKEVPPADRPPVLPTFLSFRGMVLLGLLMGLLAALAVFWSFKPGLETRSLFLWGMLLALPLPYIAGQLGWMVAELGRQPWIVYGVLKTSEAVSTSITAAQVWISLTGFTLLYGGLGVIDVFLLAKFAKKGPDEDISQLLNTKQQEA